MSTFPCAKCHQKIEFQLETLKPGDQFMVSCPRCGFTNSGGMGYPAQQMPPQAGLGQSLWSSGYLKTK